MSSTVAEQIRAITEKTTRGELTWRSAAPGDQYKFATELDKMRMLITSNDGDDGHPFDLWIYENVGEVIPSWETVAGISSGGDQDVNEALFSLYHTAKAREGSISDALSKFLGG